MLIAHPFGGLGPLKKAILSLLLLSAFLALFGRQAVAATYYIDFASGSDSSAGTKASPWKRHPYMAGFTGSYTHQAGDQFIFKGGVTWDHTAFALTIAAGGSANTPDYYGVDQTWYDSSVCGSSFCRPIFSGDHTTLASGTSIIQVSNISYVTIDNIEIKGHDAATNWGPASINLYCSSHIVMQYLFVHDWSGKNLANDDAHGGIFGNSPGCSITGTVVDHSTLSNTEAATSGKQNGVAVRAIDVQYSTIHDVSTAQLFGRIHHSTLYNVSYPSSNYTFDPSYHTNVTYLAWGDGSIHTGDTAFWAYDNIVHDFAAGSGGLYLVGCGSYSVYNNVIWNNYAGGNTDVQVDQYQCSGGNFYLWNNTLQGAVFRQVQRGSQMAVLDTRDNHYITDGTAITLTDGVSSRIDGNNVTETNAAATTAGYVAANNYQPTAANSPTVGAGLNLTSLGVSSLDSDLLGVARPATGPWNAGAYEFNSSNPITYPPTVNPPLVK